MPASHENRRLSLENKRLEDAMVRMRSAMVCSLTALVDLKDFETGVHSTRLAEWAVRVGKELGLGDDAVQDLEAAAILHDIGKIGISDEILNKKGSLSAEEYAEVRKHPEYGWGVLREIPGFAQTAIFVLYHHERLDGHGYPAGLEGNEIPLGARVVAVIDAFDAMTTNRAYRSDLGVAEAVKRLRGDSGTQFDPEVVEAFCRILESERETLAAEAVAKLAG